eukprot:tig00000057_g86.t1
MASGSGERAAAPAYIDGQQQATLEHLKRLVSFKSISSDESCRKETLACAREVMKLCTSVGLENARLLTLPDAPTALPCVYAEHLHAPGKPTILLYAHFDVQPIGDATKWHTPPFECVLKEVPAQGGLRMYARGAADDKAGVMAALSAIDALLKTGTLAVNVKVLFEGEEEIGSIHLERYLEANLALLKSDAIVLADTGNFDCGVPSITYSLRGIVDFEVEVRVLKQTLHSGLYGGPVMDALTALCRMLATLHDEHGAPAVPGILDGVRKPLPKEEESLRALQAALPDETFRAQAGMVDGAKLCGTPGVSALRKVWQLPAINVIGMDACSIAESSNRILPVARAKISIRIVPDQNPDHIAEVVKKHLKAVAPHGVQVSFHGGDGLKPWVCVPEGKAFGAMEEAMRAGYGKEARYCGSGGSIGFVEPFVKAFGGIPAILVGIEDPYTQAHGENESLLVPELFRTSRTLAHFLSNPACV